MKLHRYGLYSGANDRERCDRKLQSCHTCFVPLKMMPLLLGKDLSPCVAFSWVYPWLEAHGLLETCKPLADFMRTSNAFTNNEVPGSGVALPGMLFKQDIDLELYMDRMALHQDLTGLQALPIETPPNMMVAPLTLAVEPLKDAELQDNNKIA